MNGLTNKTIAIAADRRAEAIATLVKKHGGSPEIFSIQGQRIYNQSICRENIGVLINQFFDWVILTTGIGVRTLEQAAVEMNQEKNFLDTLRQRKLAIRGSKTRNWLKSRRLAAECVSPDGTMKQLFAQLAADAHPAGKKVYLQVYDEDEAELTRSFEKLGYVVYLSKPYHYQKPDPPVLQKLTASIIGGAVDAVIFTSKTQVRNLFHQIDQQEDLVRAFNQRVLAVAIGKVTGGEIADQGVHIVVRPDYPKMGAMIVTLSRYYANSKA